MKKYSCFPRVALRKLMSHYQFGILVNEPKEMCALLMPYKDKTCIVPLEAVRIIHRHLGDAIAKADRVNEYKMEHGYNPGVNEPV